MPTYQYKCDKCRYEFDKFQSITARPLRKCPKCGKSALNRLIGTGAGVIFKGSGFYQTDYRSESYRNAQKKEKDTGKEKKEEKKTEPKTEPKESKSPEKSKSEKDKKKSASPRN